MWTLSWWADTITTIITEKSLCIYVDTQAFACFKKRKP